MDRYEGKGGPDNKEMHSVEVQANATESGCLRALCRKRSEKGRLLEVQPCKQILSVDKIVLVLYCYNKAPQDVHVVRNT